MNLAPIILFVYNRPWHTKQTIEALQKNTLAKESELFIYSDYAKNDEILPQMKEVRDYIKTINGFKKITIIKREKNWGLDPSIINGVTKIVNKYGKIIVLEDDIVVSPYFLKFMNEALNFYQNEKRVFHISGWNYPIPTDGLDDVFLYRVMNCWGWATWKDHWSYFEPDLAKSINNYSALSVKRFDMDSGFWKQVQINLKGKDENWDIRWYASIFKKNGLCLNPSQTFVKNIGNDGSGEHCGETDVYTSSKLCLNNNIKFLDKIVENKMAVTRVQQFFKALKKPFLVRIINKMKKLMK